MLFSFHCSGYSLLSIDNLSDQLYSLGYNILLLSEHCCLIHEDSDSIGDDYLSRLLRAFTSVGYPAEFTTLIQVVDRYLLVTSREVLDWLRSHGIPEDPSVVEVIESVETAIDSIVSDLSSSVDSGDLSEMPVPTLRGGEA